jgi:methyl-accepting chemotaxis protein
MAGARESSLRQAGGRPLREVYAQTDLYKTVPIVAAWRSVAGRGRPEWLSILHAIPPDMPPRNPKNSGAAEFGERFRRLNMAKRSTFFPTAATMNWCWRGPVRLQASCLSCHGDPANSPTGDGKDVLGFPMENAESWATSKARLSQGQSGMIRW